MLQMVTANEEPVRTPDFSDFWALYPRKVAKKDAARAWHKLDQSTQVAALVGLAAWLPVWQHQLAQKEDAMDYLPHPATWINGERWEDELPQAFRQKAASHRVDSTPEQPSIPSASIPPHVLDTIRKFKERAKR